jgi:hypothetical protein
VEMYYTGGVGGVRGMVRSSIVDYDCIDNDLTYRIGH